MSSMFGVSQIQEKLQAGWSQPWPSTLVVLGSGWNRMLDTATIKHEWAFADVFGCSAGVPGHDGRLVIATFADAAGKEQTALFMQGRFHTYEGYTSEEVTRPLQAAATLGVSRVLLTAAAGGLNPEYQVGDFVVLNDILTAFCPSPLTGAQFQDLSQAFAPEWRSTALQACQAQQIPVREGIYCYTRGPHYESPADKRLFRTLGADVIGMSVVPEAIMARHLGLEVLGLAFVTNLAFVQHNHQEVIAAAERGSGQMVGLLAACI